MSDSNNSTTDSRSFPFGIPSRLAFAIVLLGGVMIPGFLTYLFASTGLPNFGSAVWVVGYGTMIFVVWYGWIRPVDFTGAAGTAGSSEQSEMAGESDESVSEKSTETADESADHAIQDSTGEESATSPDHSTTSNRIRENHDES